MKQKFPDNVGVYMPYAINEIWAQWSNKLLDFLVRE